MLRALTLVLALTTAARANALTDADAQRFDAFERKAHALMQDLDNVTAASLGSSGNDCLLNLGRDFQFVLMEIEALKTVVDLEPGMVDTGDDARVLVALRSQVKSFLPSLPSIELSSTGTWTFGSVHRTEQSWP